MEKGYYTIEQISKLLNMHPKTIQRYIREGKLSAVKVGKAWRISGHDLSIFIERNKTNAEQFESKRTITVSSVVDIAANGTDDAMRIMNLLTSAMNAKPPEFSKSSMQSQYIEYENMVRVMLWGEIRFMSAMIEMISAIAEE